MEPSIAKGGWLAGKKTYITGIVGIIGAVASYLVGDLAAADAGQIALTAIIGMTIRSGLK